MSLPRVNQATGHDKKNSLSTQNVSDDNNNNLIFRVKHHSVGDEPANEIGVFLTAKNSRVIFQDQDRSFARHTSCVPGVSS